MACSLPLNTKNLDISFFTFRPTVVLFEDVVEALKHFCLLCEDKLGCVDSAVLKSIHGSMIIWYGAWLKTSDDKKESLKADILPMLNNVLSKAILIDHCFLEAYAGESTDGKQVAKVSNGDTILLYSATLSSDHLTEKVSYAVLAIFKSNYVELKGSKASVCLKSQSRKRVIALCVWNSLQLCYSYILNSDYRRTVLPYLDGVPLDVKYDIFRVVYTTSVDNKIAESELQSHYKILQEQQVNKQVSEVCRT